MPLIPQLQSILGDRSVFTDPFEVAPYATDWRGRYQGNAGCVVFPSSTDQVAKVVRACADARTPLVPQGGNTSLSEGAVPRKGEAGWVVISLSRMNVASVRWISPTIR